MSGFNAADLSTVNISGEGFADLGEDYEWTCSSEEGVILYEYTYPYEGTAELNAEDVLFNSTAITEEMLTEIDAADGLLQFTVPGSVLEELGIAVLDLADLGSFIDEITYGDIAITVFYDADEAITEQDMTFEADFTLSEETGYEGAEFFSTYNLKYFFGEGK